MYSLLSKRNRVHEDAVWTCAWGHHSESNTEYIVTGSLDNYAKIWTWDEAEAKMTEQHKLEGHQLGVISSDINHDATLAVTSSTDCTVRVWELASGCCVSLLEPSTNPLESWTVQFSPDSVHYATGSNAGNIHIHNTNDASRVATLETAGKFILSVAYSPDGKFLAGASQEGIVYLFDIESGTLKHTLEGHAMPIRALAFSADNQLLLTGADDKCIKVHDCASSMPLVCTLPGHLSWVLSLSPSPVNPRVFSSGSADNTVKMWDIGERKMVHKFEDHTDQVWGVSYNANGSRLVSVSEDKSAAIYNIPV